MSDLVDFLLDRIAEDVAVAQDALERGFGGWEWLADHDINFEARTHIARHDPVRVLSECEAKRRIIDAYREFVEPDPDDGFAQFADDTPEDRTWPEYGGGMFSGLREAVRALAAVYADHPDYRAEWRP